MCSGVGFKTRNLSEGELEKFYTPAQIRAVKIAGRAQQFFWQPNAFLPVVTKTGTKLIQWGNKDEHLNLPQTAWAKRESIREGKWERTNPKPVLLDIDSGVEKKLWFDLPEGATGLLALKDGQEIVYLVTKEADEDFKAKTTHNRQPIGKILFRKR